MNYTDPFSIHPIVRQIIDRDCHVGISNRAVIRHVISKLRDGMQTFRSMPKRDRRDLMRQCIARHRQNWDLYVNVMGGLVLIGHGSSKVPQEGRKEVMQERIERYARRLEGLSIEELCSSAERLVSLKRRGDAELIAHLAEISRRRGHLELGYASLFERRRPACIFVPRERRRPACIFTSSGGGGARPEDSGGPPRRVAPPLSTSRERRRPACIFSSSGGGDGLRPPR